MNSEISRKEKKYKNTGISEIHGTNLMDSHINFKSFEKKKTYLEFPIRLGISVIALEVFEVVQFLNGFLK